AQRRAVTSVRSTARKHKSRAYRGMNNLVAKLGPSKIVEAVASTVADDDVFGINGAEFGNSLPDVVIVQWRHDVKTTDHGKHLVDARGRHCGADRVDDAAMAAGSDKPTPLHVIHSGDLVIKVVWNVNARILFRRHLVGEPKPSKMPTISVVGRRGFSN